MTTTDKSFLSRKIVSADGPKTEEVNHEASLLEWCATRIEPEEESNRRRSVLERINNIVRVWIKHTMITEFRMQEAAANQVEGRIFATGSYRYNVHTSGSDIDMVLIAPNRITREHFFNTLAARLQSEPWVTDLHCITESRVPIIAMVCDGIDIDLSFGVIRQDRVPEVITDDLLQGLDEQSVLSCNAVRVAHSIMDLVPSKAIFRQTLRFVKAWGKQRCIYSNTFGFPSGIGWAILCAFVCQCYPNQNAAGMVTRFFRTYHAWFKPNPQESGTENRAIYLTESMRAKTHIGSCWDPRESKRDAMALFPVLTPALPYGNACYNVTLTNLRQLCDEFKRGYDLVSSNLSLTPAEAKETYGPFGVWSKLLEPVAFFGEYRHYMHVRVSCSDPAHYQAYVDGAESRIRSLWAGHGAAVRGSTLEDMKQLRLHLNPHRYEDPAEARLRSQLLRKTGPHTSARFSTVHAEGGASQQSSGHHPSSAPAPPVLFTTHYFIGMTVDTRVSSAQIDLAPAIRVFNSVVMKLPQYRDGVTKLPVVSVCDMSKIPQFVKEAVGFKEAPPPAADEQSTEPEGGGGADPTARSEGGATAQSATTTTTTHTSASAGSGAVSSARSGEANSIGSAASGSTRGAAGSASAAETIARSSVAGAKRARAAEDDDDGLEQALGLDF